jgi:RHS repeat-associated protein
VVNNDRLMSMAGIDYRYDASGNQISQISTGDKQQRSFNGLNQLVQINVNGKLTQYEYDALGRRCAKITELGRTDFIWDNHQLIGECTLGEYTWYIYQPDTFTPVALIKAGLVYYYHLDQLGTPICLTDDNAQIVWRSQQGVFGQTIESSDIEHTDIVNTDSLQDKIANPIRFQGQYFDDESGLHYNRFRYYSPQQARFIHQDPIGLVGGINHYQYAPNPVNWVDPFGLLCKEGEKKLDRMLSNLVSTGGIDEAIKNKILEIAIASAVIDEPHKSALKYTPEGAKYRKEHEYDIAGLDEVNGLITLNKISISGETSVEVVSIAQFAEQHVINSERVRLNPDSKPTKYHKRTVGEVEVARKAFPPKRAEYISSYANAALNDDNHIAHEYFNKDELEYMEYKGEVPRGYNVHHKKPIFRCESIEDPNKLENLELLPDEYHSRRNKELHWYAEGKCPYDNGHGPSLSNLK